MRSINARWCTVSVMDARQTAFRLARAAAQVCYKLITITAKAYQIYDVRAAMRARGML